MIPPMLSRTLSAALLSVACLLPRVARADGSWIVMDDLPTSPFTDTKGAGAMLPALDRPGDMAIGVICMEGHIGVYLHASSIMGALGEGRQLGTTTIRFDADQPTEERWARTGTNAIPLGHLPFNEGEANEHTIFLARELLRHKKLALRIVVQDKTGTGLFDLTGAQAAVGPILKACGL